jgi:DNA repair protein RadC
MADSVHSGHRERIREQYIRSGAEAFLDHQFLELLLTYAIPRRDTNALAHALLERFGTLEKVVTAEIAQLTMVDGIGEGTAVFLRMQGDLFRRLMLRRTEDTRGNTRLNTPVAAARYAIALLSLSGYETVVAVCLNAKKVVIACESMQNGSLTEAQIYPRNIAETALLRRAHGILLIHNHPSGDPSPSEADATATDAVRTALESVGVQLYDHLIVGGNRVFSFATKAVIGISDAETEIYSLEDFQAHYASKPQPRELVRVMEPY